MATFFDKKCFYSVWSKAIGSSDPFRYTYDNTNKGVNFSGKFGDASIIWYPATGTRYNDDGDINLIGTCGFYWSASPNIGQACILSINDPSVYPSNHGDRSANISVRCLQESTK